ncbi:hypothetical protein EYZ11_011762 [Aspergillus tanneri]|uniref:Ribosylnicotinamide kinase n=1 Tax=Aspergillus tanneri TaxID=1220188 RepID=A0A4S3J2A3_9EURO|nr:hypothetical protein EYZ11_011762 [Aspergillus tanneri]
MRTSIIGISGPSSSGKTTLARLLQRIFCSATPHLQTFIIHEDDFYYPDDRIPYTTTPSGKIVQDWDTISAIDVSFLSSTLSYVRNHGVLPPRLKSKEDLNEKADSGVDEDIVAQFRREVQSRLTSSSVPGGCATARTVAFLEGFLLYAPPESEVQDHELRSVHGQIDVRLFLPTPYDLVKTRRESRSGYVTIGPAPVSTTSASGQEISNSREVDLEAEDDRPPQNFWTDPPGYVDDIVWPRYVQDHAWLLLPEQPSSQVSSCLGMDSHETIHVVGQGVNLRTDAGVTVAPGQGSKPMVDILRWAVEVMMKHLEETTA